MANKYLEVAPNIAAVLTEIEIDNAIPDDGYAQEPETPTLNKNVVNDVIRYIKCMNANVVNGTEDGYRNNGPVDIVNKINSKYASRAITSNQVLELINEWKNIIIFNKQNAPLNPIEMQSGGELIIVKGKQ